MINAKKTARLLLMLLSSSALIVSCSKQEDAPPRDVNTDQQTAVRSVLSSISLSDADYTVPIEVASLLAVNLNTLMVDSKMPEHLEVKKYFTIKDSMNNPSLYVFDYTDGGFAVLSADERYSPVLAMVPKGSYETCKNLGGIDLWFDETRYYISLAKQGKIDSKTGALVRWKQLLDDVSKLSGINNTVARGTNGCSYPTYTSVGVGMTTEWAQGCGYNDSITIATVPNAPTCTGTGVNRACQNNTNAPTGCVATALAQVIKFWQYPTPMNYNFTGMPDVNPSTGGNAEIHRLMRDAGLKSDMTYLCSGSGTIMTKAQLALYRFGFRNVDYAAYGNGNINLNLVISNITNGYPVILAGKNNSLGHAWVCNGYQKLVSSCYTYYYLHMNWGWGPGQGNGWYENNNWNSPKGTFNLQKEMLYNILPPY